MPKNQMTKKDKMTMLQANPLQKNQNKNQTILWCPALLPRTGKLDPF